MQSAGGDGGCEFNRASKVEYLHLSHKIRVFHAMLGARVRRRVDGVVVVIVVGELCQRVKHRRCNVHNHLVFGLKNAVDVDVVSGKHVVRLQDLFAVQVDL